MMDAHHAAAEHTTSNAGHAGPAQDHASVATYIKVAVILSVVTALEVGVTYVRALTPVVVPLLLGMSLAKFALVVMFFMHLKFDSRIFTVVFVGPLIIAVAIVVSLMTLAGAFLVFGR